MSLIIIPFEYNDLHKSKQAEVIPICVDGHDEHGAEIDKRWFTKGVAPAYHWLLRCAHRVLGDPLRASEITERAIHALWRARRDNLGDNPPAQVAARAQWEARDVRSEKTRSERRAKLVYTNYERMPVSTDYNRVYAAKLDLDLILERMRRDGKDLEAIAYGLIRGLSLEEIAGELGLTAHAVTKRMYRWKKEHITPTHGLQRRCGTISARAERSSPDKLPEPES